MLTTEPPWQDIFDFEQGVFVKHECFHNSQSPKTVTLISDLDIKEKRSHPKEYICEICKLYHLQFKSYGQVLSGQWLVVLRFNATLTAKVISWRLVTHMCFLLIHTSTNTNFFPKPPTIFLTSAMVRDENTMEINFTSTRSQIRIHQVMSPTRSPPNHPGGAILADKQTGQKIHASDLLMLEDKDSS